MSVWTVVVAGGVGQRFGSNKQLVSLDSETRVIDAAVAVASANSDGVVVVCPPELGLDLGDAHANAGSTRSESVRAGLEAVPLDADVIVVHDGARPLASTRLFRLVIQAVHAGADAAVPVTPVIDTIKRVQDGAVVETVARDQLYQVQTPQAFAASWLRLVHEDCPEFSDDAGLVELAGGKVVVVDGEPENLKITVPTDVDLARALWLRRGKQDG